MLIKSEFSGIPSRISYSQLQIHSAQSVFKPLPIYTNRCIGNRIKKKIQITAVLEIDQSCIFYPDTILNDFQVRLVFITHCFCSWVTFQT